MKQFYTKGIIYFILFFILFFSSCPPTGPSGSTDQATLLITEVGSCPFTNISSWFEVYNASATMIQLGDYQLRVTTRSIIPNYPDTGIQTFDLNSLDIQPGSYILVRGKTEDTLFGGDQINYVINNEDMVPNWAGGGGFIELLKNGKTVDFVGFGDNIITPITDNAWKNTNAPVPSGSDNYGYSIARNGSNSDTNQDTDWYLRTFATPGGPNDVNSNTDDDQDGIPDCAEEPLSTFAGLPLYQWGARTGQKDISYTN